MSDQDLGIALKAKNETNGPLKEAAEAFAEVAEGMVKANEKVAKASEDAGAKHKKAAKDIEEGATEHVGRAQEIWNAFTHHLQEDMERGFGEGLGKKLAEGVMGIAEAVAEFPFELFEKMKEHLLESAKAEDAAYKNAKTLGTSAEFFTGLSAGMARFGASSDDVRSALLKLQVNIGEGSEKFQQWGLKFRDANGDLKDTEPMLREIADRIAGLDEPAAQAALANDLLGKSGKNLLGGLREGSEGIEELIGHAKSLGGTIDDADAKLGNEFIVSLGNVKEALEGVWRTIANVLEPVLIPFFKSAAEQIGHANTEIKSHRAEWTAFAGDMATKTIGAVIGVLEAFDKIEKAVHTVGSAYQTLKSAWEDSLPAKAIGAIKDAWNRLDDALGGVLSKTTSLLSILPGMGIAFGPTVGAVSALATASEDYETSSSKLIGSLEELRGSLQSVNAEGGNTVETERKKGDALRLTQGEITRAKKEWQEWSKISDEDARENLQLYNERLKQFGNIEKAYDRAMKTRAEAEKKGREIEVAYAAETQKEKLEDAKKAREKEEKQTEESAKRLATTIGSAVGSATKTFVVDLIKGKSVMDDLKAAAERLVEQLIEAAAKAVIIASIKGAMGVGGGGDSGGGGGGFFGDLLSGVAAAAPAIAMAAAAEGGFVQGGRIRRMASGGVLAGGVKGIDSIPVLAQDGEAFLSAPTTAAVRRELSISGGSGSGFASGGMVASSGNMPVIQQNVLAFAGSRAQLRQFQRDQWGPDADLVKRRGYTLG